MPLIIPAAYPQVGTGGQFSQNPLPPGDSGSGGGGSGGGNVNGPTTSLIRSIAIWLDAQGQRLGDSQILIDAGGNLITAGLIDGRDVSQDGVVLDGITAQLVNLPTAAQKAALAGTSGTPGAGNKYVTDADPRLVGTGFALPAGQLGGTLGHPTVLGVRETGGPTELTFGVWSDGQIAKRTGTTISGTSAASLNAFINVLDYGADPTGVADSLTAFNNAMAATVIGGRYIEILVPSGQYLLSDTLVINRPINMRGAGTQFNRNTTLLVPKGRDCVRINYQGGPVAGGAAGSKISDMKIEHTTGTSAWQAATSYVVNVSAVRPTTYAGFVYRCIASTGVSGGVEPVWPTTEGATIVDGGATWLTVYAAGVKVFAKVILDNLFVSGVGGDGISVFASTGDGNNANGFGVNSCLCTGNLGWGFFTQGADSNGGTFTDCTGFSNNIGGFWDNSFLGNTYTGCVAEGNGTYGYYVAAPAAVNASAFLGCYTESGQTNSINGKATWIGNGRGILNYGTGMILDPDRSNTLYFRNDTNNDDSGDAASIKVGRMFSQTVLEYGFSQNTGGINTPIQLGYGVTDGGGTPGWVAQTVLGASNFAWSIGNAPEGPGHFWVPHDFMQGNGSIRVRERVVGGTALPTGVGSEFFVRERSPQVTGAYGFQRLFIDGTADGWGTIKAHRARITSGTQTLVPQDYHVSASAVPSTLTLPAAGVGPDTPRLDNGLEMSFKDESYLADHLTPIIVDAGGSETIDGQPNVRITRPGDAITMVRRADNWVQTKLPADRVNINAFGRLYGDGTTDDYAVIQAALDAGPAPGTDPSGNTLFLPRGVYRISQPLKVRRCMIFEGESSGSFNGLGTVIKPDKGVEGIQICGVFDSGISPMRADLAIVRNLTVNFGAGTQPTVWTATHAYSVGDLVVPTTSNPAHHWIFQVTVAGTSAGTEPLWSTYSEGDLITDGGATWLVKSVSGISMRVKSMIENVSILNAPANGIRIYGSTGSSPSTNCNAFILRRINVQTAGLNGIFIDGADANAGYAEKCFVSSARFWGIYDSSFLGNTHVAHDVDNCGLGPYHDDSLTAKNVWMGCYSESGQPASVLTANSLVLSGLHGAGFASNAYGARNIAAHVNGDTPFNVIGPLNGTTLRLNDTSVNKYAYGWLHSSESGDIRLSYSPSGMSGWWSYQYAGLDAYNYFAFAGDQAGNDAATGFADLGSLWIQPSRNEGYFYLGFQKQKIGNIGASAAVPTVANYKKGDFVFDYFWDYQGHASATRDGLHGWQFDKTGSAPWAARWPFFGHGSQQAKTNGVGSPYAIVLKADAGITFTNQGATAKVYITLPAVSGGGLVDDPGFVEYSFLCVDADGIRVTSPSPPITLGAQATASSGYLETTDIGACVTIKCFSSSFWYISKITGSWTDGTSTFSGGSGGASATHTVVDQTTNVTLTNSDAGKTYTNQGAGGTTVLTSPASPATGWNIRMRVSAAQTFTFQLPGGHTAYLGAGVTSTSGGTVSDNAIGDAIDLEYVGNSKWFVTAITGTWTAA